MISQMTIELPAVQRLALSYAPARARPDHLALLALDGALAAILRKRREPLLAQIKLAWWRDTLNSPVECWPQGNAVLDMVRGWREPASLIPLVNGWEALLSDDLTPGAITDFVDGRGLAFAALAQQLGVAHPDDARQAGQLWALADLATHISDGEERQLVVKYGQGRLAPPRLSATMRPLAVLAGLAFAALKRGGGDLLASPWSALLAVRIGFTGR